MWKIASENDCEEAKVFIFQVPTLTRGSTVDRGPPWEVGTLHIFVETKICTF